MHKNMDDARQTIKNSPTLALNVIALDCEGYKALADDNSNGYALYLFYAAAREHFQGECEFITEAEYWKLDQQRRAFWHVYDNYMESTGQWENDRFITREQREEADRLFGLYNHVSLEMLYARPGRKLSRI